MTCCRGWWAGPGRCRWRATSATSARSTPTERAQGGVARAGRADDHHPDAVAHRPARRGHRPARLLPRARRPGPQLRASTSTSTSIVKQRFDNDIYVNYSKKEIVSRVEDLEHELVREAMQMTGVANGVEITTLADIPSAGGSGLGSSSAVTVGLLHALFAYQGRQVSAEELAERACTIEIDRCGKPIGKQDQYIAALGGIRDIRFGPGDEVVAEELELSAADRRALQQQIMLFYTGITRSANSILAEQNAQHRSHPSSARPPA